MKALKRLLCLAGLACSVQASQLDFDRYTYWSLLISSQPEDVRLGARSIGREEISDTQTLDVAAAILWQLRHFHRDDAYSDTLSWLAKDLGLSRNPRYRAFLQRCRNEFFANEKLTNYIDEALQRMNGDTDTSFDPTSFNVSDVQAALMQLKSNTEPDTSGAIAITPATPLRVVYQQRGLPDHVGSSIRAESVPGWAHWDLTYLRVWYADRGYRFSLKNENSTNWTLMDQWPLVTTAALRYQGNDWDLAYSLWTSDPLLLREAIKRLYQEKLHSTAVLDVLADRLWLSLSDPKPELADAFAWACRVLEQSRNGRYVAVLGDVALQSSDKKLAKYASNALEKLSSPSDDIYRRRDDLTALQMGAK